MRTSFHHQSEAQSPNGPLTAATSPDTPSPSPTTHSDANRDFSWFDEYPRFCGDAGRLAVSAGKKDRFRGSSGRSVSGDQKPFPGSMRRDIAQKNGRPVAPAPANGPRV